MRYIILFFLGILVLPDVIAQNQDLHLIFPVNEDIEGWKLSGQPDFYQGEELYYLIDGGADIYMEYGFNRVIGGEFTNPAGIRLRLEIYEMTDNAAAFGIFSINHHSLKWNNEVGDESVLGDDFFAFRKKNYYTIISKLIGSGQMDLEMIRLGRIVASKIDSGAPLPGLIIAYPKDERMKSVTYLRGPIALSNIYYFSPKNIFNIKEGLSAAYDGYQVIVLNYENKGDAERTLITAMGEISEADRFSGFEKKGHDFICNDQKGNRLEGRLSGNMILICLIKDPMKSSDEILNKVIEGLNKKE